MIDSGNAITSYFRTSPEDDSVVEVEEKVMKDFQDWIQVVKGNRLIIDSEEEELEEVQLSPKVSPLTKMPSY